MSDENAAAVLMLCGSAIVIAAAAHNQKKCRPRKWWQNPMFRKRESSNLFSKFQYISGQYKNFSRMSPTDFEYLLQKIGPKIYRRETHFRQPISNQDRLAVTLRFLATGDSYTSLQYLFRISKQSIGRIIPEVCEALLEELIENVQMPSNPMEWMNVVRVFEEEWNMPHCLGAMGGKHVLCQAPNPIHKSQISIVLLAIVDASYNFMYAEVDCQGRTPESGLFKDTTLFTKLKNDDLGLPPAKELPGRKMKVPYFFVADSAFPLSKNVMKPYSGDFARGTPQRNYNYRVFRARRVVENAFGIISSVFRVLRNPMLLEAQKAELVVLTIIHLHNFLRKRSPHIYAPQTMFDAESNGVVVSGSWRSEEGLNSMTALKVVPRKSPVYARQIRDEVADYCCKEGVVPWQNSIQWGQC